MNQKQFLQSGRYLLDEVKRRAEKGSPHFFDTDTMRFFSSRVSELMWSSGKLENYQTEKIYFITSEADKGHIKHDGSKRGFTVRVCPQNGNLEKISEFQEFETLAQARKIIKEAVQK